MTPIIWINISHLRQTHAALINSKQQHGSTTIISRYTTMSKCNHHLKTSLIIHIMHIRLYISSVPTLNHLITTSQTIINIIFKHQQLSCYHLRPIMYRSIPVFVSNSKKLCRQSIKIYCDLRAVI